MGWQIYDEAIDMQQRRFGYFPKVFAWRGRRHVVQSVERCWTVPRRLFTRAAPRHCFKVDCTEGTFELYQDTRSNTWHVRRARLCGSRLSASWPTWSVQPERTL